MYILVKFLRNKYISILHNISGQNTIIHIYNSSLSFLRAYFMDVSPQLFLIELHFKSLKSILSSFIPMSNYKIKQLIVAIPFWGILEQKFYLIKKEESKNARGTSPDEKKLKKSLIVPRWVARHSHIIHNFISGPTAGSAQ